jgi:cyclic pyranopterin phosphate synthase
MQDKLSHVDDQNRARMVDVSGKKPTVRTAVAKGQLICHHKTLALVQENRTPKGAVISTAELAGVMGAKRTAELIPLCHPLNLTKVRVDIQIAADLPGFDILAEVKTEAQTGVEMEALTAVSVAALTLFDMLKAVDKTMRIEGIAVLQKTGGKSGDPLNRWQQTD